MGHIAWNVLKEFHISTQAGEKDLLTCSAELGTGEKVKQFKLAVHLVLQLGMKGGGNLLCRG